VRASGTIAELPAKLGRAKLNVSGMSRRENQQVLQRVFCAFIKIST
jgi:hypothetical protein